MRRHLSLIFAGLIALCLPAWVHGQDVTAPRLGGTDSSAQAQRERQLQAARERWEGMSTEEKQRLLERWRQYQQLPEDTRKQALDNYNRLKEAESGAGAENPTINPENPVSPATESPTDLAQRLRKFSGDEVYRERLRQLHDELGRMLREDPQLLERLRRLPPHEQRDVLMQARERVLYRATFEFLLEIGVDEIQAQQVMDVIEDGRQFEDNAFREYRDQMRDHDRRILERIRDVAGDRGAMMVQRFMRAGIPAEMGPRDGVRDGEQQGPWHRGPNQPPPNGPPLPPSQLVPSWERWERAAREAHFSGPAVRQLHEAFDQLMHRLSAQPHHEGPPPSARELIFSVLRSVENLTSSEQRREFARLLFGNGNSHSDRPERDRRR